MLLLCLVGCECKEHTFGEWTVESEATCSMPGKEVRICEKCEKVEEREISVLEHSFNEWVIEKDSTCALEGKKIRTCENCKKTEEMQLAKLKHTYSDWFECEPSTCTTRGTLKRTCVDCSAEETIPSDKLEHNWIKATCFTPKICSVCETTEGDAMGHSWNDATCVLPKTCTMCQATEGTPKGHTWKDANCTEPKTCTVCNTTEGAPMGHTFSSPDCKTLETCEKCGVEGTNMGSHQFENAFCKLCRYVDKSAISINVPSLPAERTITYDGHYSDERHYTSKYKVTAAEVKVYDYRRGPYEDFPFYISISITIEYVDCYYQINYGDGTIEHYNYCNIDYDCFYLIDSSGEIHMPENISTYDFGGSIGVVATSRKSIVAKENEAGSTETVKFENLAPGTYTLCFLEGDLDQHSFDNMFN
ncbi:MAG: hypothetical protein IKK26_06235 [Clostridia bacterium]|nr:hypothetical protein [Clostridia bacterium]